MGDEFQQQWVASMAATLRGPVLEIGSRRKPNDVAFFDYRTILTDVSYTGIDIAPGLGVDCVCDLTDDSPKSRLARGRLGMFNTVLCLSTLEHVRDPFALARNAVTRLRCGGTLVVSVPFAWVLHDHPDDYWRFTPSGVRALFPTIRFDETRSYLHAPSGRAKPLSDPAALDHIRHISLYLPGDRNAVVWNLDSYVGEGVMVSMVGEKP